ncbi:MAG: hypothetical protein ABIQ84_01585 [Usitatibacter sp.]
MKAVIALCTFALLAGCATRGEQVAAVDCKIYPITTASAAGGTPRVNSLEQRHAEMQLATSDYRMRNLRQNGYNMNNVEDALRDCNAR